MRSVWLSVASLSLVGSLAAGCGPLGGNGGNGGNEDAGDGGTDSDTADAPEFQTYHYVLVEDLENPETSSPTSTAGADIDAIELESGGESVFANTLEDFNEGPGDNDFADDPEEALGEPEGECPTSGTANYFAMGGVGGFLIVSFPELAEINTGDTIRVYECGATEELFDAFVGVGTSPTDPTWIRVITDGTGVSEGTVPQLTEIPVE